ncbi:MAG: hypothetical protein SGJ13_09655, partial [Actinomycetota bacterium]|nr:hypothetical protein [Actinomycetota bacterium]
IDAQPRVKSRATAVASRSGGARVPTSILDLAETVSEEERDGESHDARRSSASFNRLDSDPMIDLSADNDVRGNGNGNGGGGGGGRGRGPTVSTEAPAFAALLERITETVEPARPPALATAVREQLDLSTGAARRSATAARISDDMPVPDLTADDVAVLTETVTPVVFRRVARSDQVLERPENVLARLGLPARLVPRGVELREMRGALLESLARLPTPSLLPDAPGVVVAVVGEGAQPVRLARDLAEELGLDPDRVVLATHEPLGEGIPAWLQVCDPQTAEERRRSWRRRPYPTLVACALPAGRGQLEWARAMLDQFEPTSTWAIIEAGWKCEDVEYLADALGGLDVLALTNLDETVSPAAVLDLGIAIGRIEGRPATPLTWAEVLMQRIVE